MKEPSEFRIFGCRLPPVLVRIIRWAVFLFFGPLLLAGALQNLTWFLPQSAFAYALQYNIPTDHVTIEAKPHGCDFEDAPLGEKHCHYKAFVIVQRACDSSDVNCHYYYPSLPETPDNQPITEATRVLVSWDKISD